MPDTEVTLRPATPTDAHAIALLHAHSWRRTYVGIYRDAFLKTDLVMTDRLDVWRDRLDTPGEDQLVTVATIAGRIVGFICVYRNADPTWGSLIDNLHVESGHQDQGIGSALMSEAARCLESLSGHAGMYLWVMAKNHRARRFYERLSATNAETVMLDCPGGGSAPACRYVWRNSQTLVDAARQVLGLIDN